MQTLLAKGSDSAPERGASGAREAIHSERPRRIARRCWMGWAPLVVLGFLSLASSLDALSVPQPPRLVERARVIVVEDPQSVSSFAPVPEKLPNMLAQGLAALTGESKTRAAWGSLVSTQEVLGIKVFSAPGPISGTRPAVVGAIIESLLEAGFPTNHILIWDKQFSDLRRAGFVDLARRYGVRCAGAGDQGYDERVFYESSLLGKLVWGDFEFGKDVEGRGRRSYVSKLVTQEITKILNVTPLLNHNLAGVSGNLYGLGFGSVDNTIRFETAPEHLATGLPEIYALPELGDRVVLNIVDALLCQYQGEERTYFHYSAPIGQLRFSKDPVALDILSIEELNRQRELVKAPAAPANLRIYSNASLLQIGTSDLKRIDAFNLP